MLYPGSQFLNYVHLANTTHIPDNVDLAVIPSQQVFMGVNVSATPNMCPSLLNVPKIILQQKMAETKNELQVLKNKLDGGNTTDLLNLIASGGNPNTIKTTLLDKSPFLTDEVLLNYLSSGAASAMKKDVLIANSHLTDPVLTAVNNSNLSNGTKNQIFAAQNGISEREKLYNEISFVDGEYQYAYNDLLSQMLLDTSETATYDEAIDFLNQLDDEKSKKTLLDLYVLKEDFTSATNLRNSLATELLDSDFFDLHDVKTQIRIVSAVDVALNDQPQLAASLEELDNFAVNTQVQARAKVLLEMLNGSSEVPDFLPLSDYGAKMMQFQQEESEPYTFFQVVSIYPNPSNGIVNFDLPEIEEGSLTITIFELSGKEVYSATFQNTNGDRVDLSHLQKGTYLAKIAIENKYTEAQLIQLR